MFVYPEQLALCVLAPHTQEPLSLLMSEAEICLLKSAYGTDEQSLSLTEKRWMPFELTLIISNHIKANTHHTHRSADRSKH